MVVECGGRLPLELLRVDVPLPVLPPEGEAGQPPASLLGRQGGRAGHPAAPSLPSGGGSGGAPLEHWPRPGGGCDGWRQEGDSGEKGNMRCAGT